MQTYYKHVVPSFHWDFLAIVSFKISILKNWMFRRRIAHIVYVTCFNLQSHTILLSVGVHIGMNGRPVTKKWSFYCQNIWNVFLYSFLSSFSEFLVLIVHLYVFAVNNNATLLPTFNQFNYTDRVLHIFFDLSFRSV